MIKNAATTSMSASQIEDIVNQAAASFRFEGLIIDDEDMENARKILRREISGDEMVRLVIMKHGYAKNP